MSSFVLRGILDVESPLRESLVNNLIGFVVLPSVEVYKIRKGRVMLQSTINSTLDIRELNGVVPGVAIVAVFRLHPWELDAALLHHYVLCLVVISHQDHLPVLVSKRVRDRKFNRKNFPFKF